ncbi:MAG: HU family DNA-binding protein [Prevotellaceae bacterium]|nr:HU family DNA-binding protein [Prevotellaceae bacterium]
MGIQVRKSKIKLNYLEEKPERYKIQQLTYPAVTFTQLVSECSKSCGVNPAQTKAVIDALVDRLIHYMEIGHGVQMGNFGSFKPTITVRSVKQYDDANTDTVKTRRVTFFPGKAFKSMLGELSITQASEYLNDEE